MKIYTAIIELTCGCGFPKRQEVHADDLEAARHAVNLILQKLRRDTGSSWRIKSIQEKSAS